MSQKQAKRRRREHQRHVQEVRAALAEQLRLLEKRCREFDAGDVGEAADIATRLRVIFHPGGKSSPSILQSLDARKVPILTTCEYRADAAHVLGLSGGLYTQRMGRDDAGTFYELFAALGDSLDCGQIPALKWWDAVVEVAGGGVGGPDRQEFRRKYVAKGIAEHDGGAHFASRIPESYELLTKPGGLVRLTIGEEGDAQKIPIEGVHLVMLRQMAYEALNSPALRDLARPDAG